MEFYFAFCMQSWGLRIGGLVVVVIWGLRVGLRDWMRPKGFIFGSKASFMNSEDGDCNSKNTIRVRDKRLGKYQFYISNYHNGLLGRKMF